MRRRPPQQLLMTFGWGGWRPGAGRKPRRGRKRRVPHRRRRLVRSRYPLHVTLRLRRDLDSMREESRVAVIGAAFVAGCKRDGFRIIDWSIQDDHLHLIVEARDNLSLSRGIQGFCVRVARGLNQLLGRRGSVFEERYHVRELTTPREVRNARAYVMNNLRRHAARSCGQAMPEGWMDPASSWAWFDGWRDCPRGRQDAARDDTDQPPVAEPESWLLREGWRRHGLVGVDEIPGLTRLRRRLRARSG